MNDEHAKILLDAGANHAAIIVSLERTIELKVRMSTEKQIDVQKFEKSKMVTTSRFIVKIILR